MYCAFFPRLFYITKFPFSGIKVSLKAVNSGVQNSIIHTVKKWKPRPEKIWFVIQRLVANHEIAAVHHPRLELRGYLSTRNLNKDNGDLKRKVVITFPNSSNVWASCGSSLSLSGIYLSRLAIRISWNFLALHFSSFNISFVFWGEWGLFDISAKFQKSKAY